MLNPNTEKVEMFSLFSSALINWLRLFFDNGILEFHWLLPWKNNETAMNLN